MGFGWKTRAWFRLFAVLYHLFCFIPSNGVHGTLLHLFQSSFSFSLIMLNLVFESCIFWQTCKLQKKSFISVDCLLSSFSICFKTKVATSSSYGHLQFCCVGCSNFSVCLFVSFTFFSVLQLCYNNLTGSIPTQLGALKKLSVVALQSNQLTGAIPASLGDLGLLARLDLSSNNLFGSIPTSLAEAPSLRVLDVHNNTLSGNVPPGNDDVTVHG